MASEIIIESPEILGGEPVFKGTRVPVKILFEYLEGGESYKLFLDEYPTVTAQQATSAIKLAEQKLLATQRN
jgi:uncharacterized protein (DUF433 family)